MTAPILLGYLCRVCGAERIQTPWDEAEGYLCGNCGCTNLAPLLSKENVWLRYLATTGHVDG